MSQNKTPSKKGGTKTSSKKGAADLQETVSSVAATVAKVIEPEVFYNILQ